MVNLTMEINDYYSINKASIEINKINVIGGVNGSGKSTASKIFYSFLNGNSTKRRNFAYQRIINNINQAINLLNIKENDYNLPDNLDYDIDYDEFEKIFDEIWEISKKNQELAKRKAIELKKELTDRKINLLKKLEANGIDINKYKKEYNIDDISLLLILILYYINEKHEIKLTDDLTEDIHQLKEIERDYNYFMTIQDVYFMFQDMAPLINAFFSEDSPELSKESFFEISSREYVIISKKNNINFHIGSEDNAFEYFFDKGLISSIYYIDNVSIFDLSSSDNKSIHQLFHMEEIINELFVKENFDEENSIERFELDDNIQNILEKIENIIKGSYQKNGFIFQTDKKAEIPAISIFPRNYKPHERKISTLNFNTPSGIKQIGIIQLLLINNKLQKDGYLIIDEPEVNLHPDWQFKFAEILVLLAKDLNITVYLNSHSPFFIEAIDAFTEFYDMQEDINYYLTEESEVEWKYNFTKIESDELYKIYENLGNAYDLINQLRLRKRLEK